MVSQSTPVNFSMQLWALQETFLCVLYYLIQNKSQCPLIELRRIRNVLLSNSGESMLKDSLQDG